MCRQFVVGHLFALAQGIIMHISLTPLVSLVYRGFAVSVPIFVLIAIFIPFSLPQNSRLRYKTKGIFSTVRLSISQQEILYH